MEQDLPSVRDRGTGTTLAAHFFHRPGEQLSLRANFIWTFLGNGVYAGCQWGMLVALAKLTTAEKVGQFALALAITAPIQMLINLQLRGIQATDARQTYSFGDYLGLRLIAVALGLVIVVGVVMGTGYRGVTAWVILVVGMAKGFESISDVFFGLLQQRERMDRIGISSMLKGVLSLAALTITVYLTGSVLWGTVALAVSWAVILLIYDVPSGALVLRWSASASVGASARSAPALRPCWKPGRLARLARLSLPLGVVMMLGSLNVNIPRYFIEHDLGQRELAIFTAMAYLMVAGSMVVNALGQAASPRLAQYYAAGRRDAFVSLMLRASLIVALLGLSGVLLSWIAGHRILAILYRPEYAQRADIFTWLVAASGILWLGAFVGYGLTAARRFTVQIPLVGSVTIVTVAVCAVLVPSYHLLGAALAILIAAGVMLLGAVFVAVYALRQGLPSEDIILVPLQETSDTLLD
jgi:O-antigen/teichoic acid export membrane protein